jgi:hypothetical protein
VHKHHHGGRAGRDKERMLDNPLKFCAQDFIVIECSLGLNATWRNQKLYKTTLIKRSTRRSSKSAISLASVQKISDTLIFLP